MRTIIDLTNEQIEALAKLSDKRDLSRAALIRAAVDDYLTKHADESWEEVFGLWRERELNGLAYQQALRDEWG